MKNVRIVERCEILDNDSEPVRVQLFPKSKSGGYVPSAKWFVLKGVHRYRVTVVECFT